MKTKKIIFFVIIFIFIIALGFFLWKAFKQPETGLVFFEDFEIKEIGDGKVISQKKTNFEITVPKNWDILNAGDSISLKAFDLHINNEISNKYFLPIPEKGCAFNFSIDKGINSISYGYVSGMLGLCLKEPKDDYCDYDVIEIDNNKSLKHISHIENDLTLGEHIIIQVPQNENVYIFEAYLFGQDKEKCAQEFEDILKTVKIGE